ncbi:hypothetical protein [Neobacillus sp. OS1-33]|uniref:hypothetical protein n=1 Tax=Neobacillus sp. OS1-33 TaxID=3070683 RepID=UPI0027E18349|nr:hypothetical protein [Neobacillus sp. OS1-33]WML26268.1 hypothetical protein RCG22_01070 [Neobacillus sp. OS1-33]
MKNEPTLLTLRAEYQYDNKLKRYSNRYYVNDNSVYSRIQSNEDVVRHENYFLGTLEQLRKNYDLVEEDIEDLGKAMARFEIAVKKVIACNDNPHCEFEYNASQLNELIQKIFKYHALVDKINQRKLFQD